MLEFVQDVSFSSSCLRLFLLFVKLSSLGSFHSGCFRLLVGCTCRLSCLRAVWGLFRLLSVVSCCFMSFKLLTSLGCFRQLTLFGLFQFDFKLTFF